MPSAAIYDCEGSRLTPEERAFFRDADPWGFIVFARHCQSPEELRAHCNELRECVGRGDTPILIDQEGGRVARMKPPDFPAHPAPALFGELWKLNPKAARDAARLNGYLLGRLVGDCGVNVNCIPMLDVPQPDADPTVIGDRAYAKNGDVIVDLARETVAGLKEAGVLPVIKHLPGHGRSLCDSHYSLPSVCASHDDLRTVDFSPFKAFADETLGMTAHVVYERLDADAPATLSRTVIRDVIRGEIGFDGLLMTDDLKMKALSGGVKDRVAGSLAAGCDIALCCNFDMKQKIDAASAAPTLAGKSADRAANASSALRVVSDDRELSPLYAQLESALHPVAA
ncbi:MAG: beta-N-acetylhexosaminidase [Pseudomonadota bacterium]